MEMIREIRATWSRDAKETEQAVIDRFVGYPLLVLDEVGIQHGTEAEKITVFDVIKGRHESRKSTVLISNLNIDEVSKYLGNRAMDRLKSAGTIHVFSWGSYRGSK